MRAPRLVHIRVPEALASASVGVVVRELENRN